MNTIDPVFETLYSAFRLQVDAVPPVPIQTSLQIFRTEEEKVKAFERWTKETQVVVGRPNSPETLRGRKAIWRDNYSTASGAHWSALRNYLLAYGGRTEEQLNKLDKASDAVLFSIADPTNEPELRSKYSGLVIGYVQSGKTANYTALTAKAFDAGYQLVIVLSGIHNSLRRQAQIRMNNELGIVASTPARPTASILGQDDPNPIRPLTSEDPVNGDFQYTNFPAAILNSGKYLCVTKKNASVLKKLIKWLGKSVTVPVLIIDDEADQASIDTASDAPVKGPADPETLDRDPTVINGQIRQLVKICRSRAYIGYTATPYANVFIPKDRSHSNFDDDLYPRDFIISLPKPEGYMGPEEFFGPNLTGEEDENESISDQVIRIVSETDAEILTRFGKRPKSESNRVLPDSLLEGVRFFILATAALRVARQRQLPTSLLVHASHENGIQQEISSALETYVDKIHQDWRYEKNVALPKWKTEWELFSSKFKDGKYKLSFDQLVPQLDELIGQYGSLPVLLLNYKSTDELDYEAEPNLCALVVGGNKLSRGLTLEGLLVSYFVRESKVPNAETLTQMGRFFGYRSDLIDLTRVFTTDSLRRDFREISLIESALRKDIGRYQKSGKTPYDFAPRVLRRAHMMPTARNKMKFVKEFGVTYSGDLVQTTSFPIGPTKHVKNQEHTFKFIAHLKQNNQKDDELSSKAGGTKILWRGVQPEKINEFLRGFEVVDGASRFVPENISAYIEEQSSPSDPNLSPELINWNVAVIGRTPDEQLGTEDFGIGLKIGRVLRSLDAGSRNSIGTLITPLNLDKNTGDELIDLTAAEIQAAKELSSEHPEMSKTDVLRSIRDDKNGLLIIYPISSKSIGSKSSTGKDSETSLGEALELDGQNETLSIIGLCLVFPNSNHDQSGRQYWSQVESS